MELILFVFFLVGFATAIPVTYWSMTRPRRKALPAITTMDQIEAEAERDWESDYRTLLAKAGMPAVTTEPWAATKRHVSSNTRFDMKADPSTYTLGQIYAIGRGNGWLNDRQLDELTELRAGVRYPPAPPP